MRLASPALITALIGVLIMLSACEKPECREDADCVREHFVGECVDKKCSYEPIPDECGNLVCEERAGENKCTCAVDCGECSGKSGKHFVLACVDSTCVERIPQAKPITQTQELSFAGSKLTTTTTFYQPFNLGADTWDLEFTLSLLAESISNVRVTRLELTGLTKDKRTVLLASKTVNKYLWAEGSTLEENLILDFTTAEKSGEFTGLTLKIFVDYTTSTAAATQQKSTVLQLRYRALRFEWAKPKTSVCPDCDDNNPGTKDYCGPETNYFCKHDPIPGVCGNFVCEPGENKCSCAQDCGPCTGTIGAYLMRGCVGTECKAQLKPGVTITPKSLFDDRDLSAFHLQNNYEYNEPFNTRTDKLVMEFSLFEKQESVGEIKITEARLLERAEEIARATIDVTLASIGDAATAEIMIPSLPIPEQQKTVTLRVWYEYEKDGETIRNSYAKALGKIVFVTPSV